MKQISSLLIALAITGFAMAAPASVTPGKKAKLNASEVFIPIGNTGYKISLMELSTIKARDLEKITGKKMKLADKLTFKWAQNHLSRSINPDGTINSKKLNKVASKVSTGDFNIGGFALGFLLWIIGVLIAYLISDDKKAERTKWAWIGFAVSLVLWLLLAVIF